MKIILFLIGNMLLGGVFGGCLVLVIILGKMEYAGIFISLTALGTFLAFLGSIPPRS